MLEHLQLDPRNTSHKLFVYVYSIAQCVNVNFVHVCCRIVHYVQKRSVVTNQTTSILSLRSFDFFLPISFPSLASTIHIGKYSGKCLNDESKHTHTSKCVSTYVRSRNIEYIIYNKIHPEGYYYYNIDLYIWLMRITQPNKRTKPTIQKKIFVRDFFSGSHTPYLVCSCDDITVLR